MDSGCHELSENICFVWSYGGEYGMSPLWTDGRRKVKIELEFFEQNSQKSTTLFGFVICSWEDAAEGRRFPNFTT